MLTSKVIALCTLILIIGNFLFFIIGFLKVMSSMDLNDLNDPELSVDSKGNLIEEYPEEEFKESEVRIATSISCLVYLIVGSLIWILMGYNFGRLAYLVQPSDIWKIIVYFLFYFFLLRFPFGVINKIKKKYFDIELMPEKLVFALFMISSFIIGILHYDHIPTVLKILP